MPPLNCVCRRVDGVRVGARCEVGAQRHRNRACQGLDSQLTHGLGNPLKLSDFVEANPAHAAYFIEICFCICVVNRYIVTKKHARCGFSQRGSDACESLHGACEPCLLLQFPKDSILWRFAAIDTPLWQTPMTLKTTLCFLNDQQSVVIHHPCGHSQVTQYPVHEVKNYGSVYQLGFLTNEGKDETSYRNWLI